MHEGDVRIFHIRLSQYRVLLILACEGLVGHRAERKLEYVVCLELFLLPLDHLLKLSLDLLSFGFALFQRSWLLLNFFRLFVVLRIVISFGLFFHFLWPLRGAWTGSLLAFLSCCIVILGSQGLLFVLFSLFLLVVFGLLLVEEDGLCRLIQLH